MEKHLTQIFAQKKKCQFYWPKFHLTFHVGRGSCLLLAEVERPGQLHSYSIAFREFSQSLFAHYSPPIPYSFCSRLSWDLSFGLIIPVFALKCKPSLDILPVTEQMTEEAQKARSLLAKEEFSLSKKEKVCSLNISFSRLVIIAYFSDRILLVQYSFLSPYWIKGLTCFVLFVFTHPFN